MKNLNQILLIFIISVALAGGVSAQITAVDIERVFDDSPQYVDRILLQPEQSYRTPDTNFVAAGHQTSETEICYGDLIVDGNRVRFLSARNLTSDDPVVVLAPNGEPHELGGANNLAIVLEQGLVREITLEAPGCDGVLALLASGAGGTTSAAAIAAGLSALLLGGVALDDDGSTSPPTPTPALAQPEPASPPLPITPVDCDADGIPDDEDADFDPVTCRVFPSDCDGDGILDRDDADFDPVTCQMLPPASP